jgi:hypothetical protein
MNKFWQATLINVACIFAIALLAALSGGKEAFGVIPVILSFFEFLLAILLVIFSRTRRVGQIMLAASGIVFLIGLGICSVFPLNFH